LKHTDGWLELRHSQARGTSRLYRQTWLPDGDPCGIILVAHGLGEHSGRYTDFARHCTDRGFAIYALDHYGHGKSEGLAGHVERFSVFLDGVRELLARVREEQTGVPVFLLGHSMGGLIASAFLRESQAAFRGCVLSGPAFMSDAAPPAVVLWVNRVLSALAPTVPVKGLDPAGVSRDPEVVRAYVSDPLVHHGKMSARLIAEMMAAMRATLASAGEIQLPLLIMHGEADVLTSPAGSREFYAHAASADKTLKLYPGLYHEIFNEPEKETVLADMTDWLEAHL
jgi:alpha-beta hydrolase superfamily lysophospholipase